MESEEVFGLKVQVIFKDKKISYEKEIMMIPSEKSKDMNFEKCIKNLFKGHRKLLVKAYQNEIDKENRKKEYEKALDKASGVDWLEESPHKFILLLLKYWVLHLHIF